MTGVDAADLDPAALHAKAWADNHALIDRQLSPLGLLAIEALRPGPGDRVLDVGCGTGQTLLQLAERVGDHGRVVGVDISGPLLEVAAQRTAHRRCISLIQSDAQTLSLPAASLDAVFSRFGVMSFTDPVAAFATFHRSLTRHGRLAFCCWRSLDDNELDLFPLRAAGLRSLADDGPFRFSDPDFVRRVLADAGFRDFTIRPQDVLVTSGDVDAMTAVLLQVGPLGKIVRETPTLRPTVEPALRTALTGLGDPARVELTAAIWLVTARA